MKRSSLIGMIVLGLAAASAAAGCSSQGDEKSNSEDEVRSVERSIIGAARPYAPDNSLQGKIEALDSSQKARRAVAWKSLAKVLKDGRIAEPDVKVDSKRAKLPAFRTWYQKDDFERMFARLYESHGAEARKARRAFTDAEVDGALAFNAEDRGSWSDDAFEERLKLIDSKAAAQGLGSNAKVQYSTGAVRHMLKHWAPLTRCARGEVADEPNAEPKSPSLFATCVDEEFPKDAAIIKVAWLRADFGLKVPVRSTSAEALTARLAGDVDEGGWGKGNPADEQAPDEASIYTVKMTDGATFKMPALHLVTKELREWLWITMWWSPEPDTDFGADRPAEIGRLGGPWKNYKMCVVTGYEEKDPDPTGGFPTGKGSLGDALKATYKGVGTPSWCSNQYIERGAHNAQTNCIGCHQHAGTSLRSEAVLADNKAFPDFGRSKIRKNFPADYLFAATQPPESIANIMQTQVEHFDTVDR